MPRTRTQGRVYLSRYIAKRKLVMALIPKTVRHAMREFKAKHGGTLPQALAKLVGVAAE